MKLTNFTDINQRNLGLICLGIIIVILIAGLWPRNFRLDNQAALMPDGKGLRFFGRGIVYSKTLSVNREAGPEPGSLSIEIAVQGDKEWRYSLPIILAFDDGQICERLIIGQWQSSIIVRSRQWSSCQEEPSKEIEAEEVLLPGKSRFIGISSSREGTAVYVDGQLKVQRKNLSILNPDEIITGRLVLGNSAAGKYAWTGTVNGLSLYDKELSPEESLRHYEAWRDSSEFSPGNEPALFARYLFNEQNGPVVKDHSGLGNDLLIPTRFTPLKRLLLTPPWEDFKADLKNLIDIAINVVGFMPFGFFISWYLSERGLKRRNVLFYVILLGLGTSLFIECMQAYLPARTSQLSDVITNTSGTAIGIFLWSRFIHRLLHSNHGG
jgi:VanZ family protein